MKCRFKPINQRSVKNILSSFSAVLHIGDTAMIEAQKLSNSSPPFNSPLSKGGYRGVKGERRGILIYDLGELWDNYTGLPFVFALWIVRKKSISQKGELIKKLSIDLLNAKKYANKELPSIAKEAPHKKWYGEKELVNYWKIISYDFTKKHLEGLRLFEKYAKKIK